jgi:hypothetical protein
LSYHHSTQKVYAKGPLDCIKAAGRRQTVALPDSAGVVDEDVEMAETGIDRLCGSGDGGGIVEINREVAATSNPIPLFAPVMRAIFFGAFCIFVFSSE